MAIESQRSLGSGHGRHDDPDHPAPQRKTPDARCLACGALHQAGRWRWGRALPAVTAVVCPACRRLKDRIPVHVVELIGDLARWREEVRAIVRRVEEAETSEHPMERVMQVREEAGRIEIPTTGDHIARRIAANLLRAFRHRVRVMGRPGHTRILWLQDAAEH